MLLNEVDTLLCCKISDNFAMLTNFWLNTNRKRLRVLLDRQPAMNDDDALV